MKVSPTSQPADCICVGGTWEEERELSSGGSMKKKRGYVSVSMFFACFLLALSLPLSRVLCSSASTLVALPGSLKRGSQGCKSASAFRNRGREWFKFSVRVTTKKETATKLASSRVYRPRSRLYKEIRWQNLGFKIIKTGWEGKLNQKQMTSFIQVCVWKEER